MKAVAVLIAAANAREAEKIARVLVQEKLAACVSAVGPMRSIYHWRGKVSRAREILLIAKTTRARLPRLVARAKSLHSYQTPEILALAVAGGLAPYLRWISASVKK